MTTEWSEEPVDPNDPIFTRPILLVGSGRIFKQLPMLPEDEAGSETAPPKEE